MTIAAASFLALIPPGMQWKENRDLERAQRVVVSEQSSQNSRFQGAGAGKRTVEDAPRSQEELLRELKTISERSSFFEKFTVAQYFGLSLKREELPVMLAILQGEFPETSEQGLEHALWNSLFIRWAQLDADAAFATAKTLLGSERERGVWHGFVAGLAGSDPVGTRQFLESLPEGSSRERLMQMSWKVHAKENPEEALQMALKIEDLDERAALMNEVVLGVREVDPLMGLAYVKTLEDGVDKEKWWRILVGTLATTNPEEAYGYLTGSSNQPRALESLPRVLEIWAGRDPDASFQVLSTLEEQDRSTKAFESYGNGLTKIEDAERAFQQLQDKKEKAALLQGFARSYRLQASYFDPPTSDQLGQLRELVESLPEGSYRKEADWEFAWVWGTKNPGEANEWVQESSNISDELKDIFANYYEESK